MTETRVVIIKASYFLKFVLDKIVNLSGRQGIDLKPDNLANLHPLADYFPLRLKQAKRLTYCVAKAIRKMHDEPRKPYQTIIILYYLDELYSREVQEKVGYSHSRYGILRKRAEDEFTGYFNYFCNKEGLSNIIKLIN
ncbi:hypothetical protein [Lactobacillus helveticus]|uniref:hypothetical protein n=1 Tax=Lactobacillus helveticus TaxID=1587 RepID=UPI00062A7BE7|nr:hypothetical protein [Lactobacillus helveticus]AKG66307.1 hypothetical protein TU99_02635 [Lactobacillus helveticus]